MSSLAQGSLFETGALDELQASMRGELVRPGDAGYDEHRKVWNGSIDRRPGLIARCAGVADVRAAVRFARRRDLLVAVRGGGHSFPGLSVCDDGLVVDLGPMKGVRVDPEAGRVRVQAGVLLGELSPEDVTVQVVYGTTAPDGSLTDVRSQDLEVAEAAGAVVPAERRFSPARAG